MHKEKQQYNHSVSGTAFLGCILVGLGIGWIIKPEFLVQGAIVGCGFGFILMALMERNK